MDMKTYDKDGTCIKCGYGGIEDVHWKARTIPAKARELDRTLKNTKDIPEHIVRTCKNCGYSWQEKPLDYEESCSFNKFVDAFIKHTSEATGMTRDELLKKWKSPDDPDSIKAKTGKPMTEDEIKAKMKEFEKKLDCLIFDVGDEITIQGIGPGRDGKVIHDVVGIVDGEIHAKPRTVAYADPNTCTLLRKGPKVHTFKGMGIVEGNQLHGDDIGSIFDGTGIYALSNNGKIYTITATEEGV